MKTLTKKEILGICGALVVLIILIAVLISAFSKRTENQTVEDLAAVPAKEADVILESDLEEEQEGVEEVYTPELLGDFDATIMELLSAAKYDELEGRLRSLSVEHKDGEGGDTGLAVSYDTVIEMYRSDLSIIRSIPESSEPQTLLKDYFFPETLASAFVYTPISTKLDAILDNSSLVNPAVLSDKVLETNLRRVPHTPQELSEITAASAESLPDLTVTGVAQYDYYAYKMEWRLTLVCLDNYMWSIQRLDRIDGDQSNLPTVDFVKNLRSQMRNQGMDFDADAMFTFVD